MKQTTAVSIRADRRYIRALNKVAEQRLKTTGELIRDVVDAALGDEIDAALVDVPESVYQHRRKPIDIDEVELATHAAP